MTHPIHKLNKMSTIDEVEVEYNRSIYGFSIGKCGGGNYAFYTDDWIFINEDDVDDFKEEYTKLIKKYAE